MKTFVVTVKFNDGSRQHVTLAAKDRDEAVRLAERQQFRRAERAGLTFARLDQALETGDPGGLAIDPRFAGQALTEAWVKGETEKRKRDLARYDSDFAVESVQEVK